MKGVHYSLDAFLGPGILNNDSEPESINSNLEEGVSETKKLEANGRQLYHVVLYLSPGDCHHFHSPANWTAYLSRHLPGIYHRVMIQFNSGWVILKITFLIKV